MKRFRCGDVVPGCSTTFTGTEGEIFTQVGVHAREAHGMASVPDHVLADVRSAMVDV